MYVRGTRASDVMARRRWHGKKGDGRSELRLGPMPTRAAAPMENCACQLRDPPLSPAPPPGRRRDRTYATSPSSPSSLSTSAALLRPSSTSPSSSSLSSRCDAPGPPPASGCRPLTARGGGSRGADCPFAYRVVTALVARGKRPCRTEGLGPSVVRWLPPSNAMAAAAAASSAATSGGRPLGLEKRRCAGQPSGREGVPEGTLSASSYKGQHDKVMTEMPVDGAHNGLSYLTSAFGLEFAAFHDLHHQAVVVPHLFPHQTANNKQHIGQRGSTG